MERAVCTTARGSAVVPDVNMMKTGSSACRCTGGAQRGNGRMRRAAAIDRGVPGIHRPTRTKRHPVIWPTRGSSRRLLRNTLRARGLAEST
jgi:hypothetical protein